MIRHVVLFSLKDPENLDFVREQLSRLGTIPGSRVFEVSANLKVDGFANAIDLVVYGEFDSVDTMAAYKAHPTYAEVTAIVKPLRDLRFAADVETAVETAASIKAA